MALSTAQQFKNLIEKSKNILLVLPQNPNGDAICSAWSLYFLLKKRNISSSILLRDEFKESEKFSFLPKPENIVSSASGSRDFVLSFNTRFNKIINVKQEFLNDELRVYITPEKGSIDPRDFSFIPAKFKFDLLIVFGSPDKESLGKIYEENPDIFYEVPLINVDNNPNNENFGQVNLVNITASSVSEAVFRVLEESSFSSEITEETANCLLSGIISATDSFQKINTSPKTLEIAAKLMIAGADQQTIIRWLYKTQSFNILRLWGRVMARLNWDENLKFAWSLVTLEDFVQSRSKPEDIPAVLEKIKENYSAGETFAVLFNEKEDIVSGIAKLSSESDIKKIADALKGEIRKDLIFFKFPGKNILEAEKEMLEKIKSL